MPIGEETAAPPSRLEAAPPPLDEVVGPRASLSIAREEKKGEGRGVDKRGEEGRGHRQQEGRHRWDGKDGRGWLCGRGGGVGVGLSEGGDVGMWTE